MFISSVLEATIEESQAMMMRKCGWCPRELHYMEFPKGGLCPECAARSLEQDRQLREKIGETAYRRLEGPWVK